MKLAFGGALAVLAIGLAACGTAQVPTTNQGAAASQSLVADPNGDTCATLVNGYCPGDEVTPSGSSGSGSPAAAQQQSDPDGQTCATLDSQGYCPGDDPSPSAPAPTMTKQTDTVVFRVWGTGEPSIQYGTDSSTNNPSEGVGPLGDGNYLPWTASMPYDAGALYYAVTAQLEGSGSIQDSVTEVVTTWCTGSKPKTESFPLASGNASGGYGIATAEYDDGDTGNASQAESDAGC